MTDIEKMAREAGMVRDIARRGGVFDRQDVPYWFGYEDQLEAFAQAVARRCAEICESRITPGTGSVAILNGAADAIRAEFEIKEEP